VLAHDLGLVEISLTSQPNSTYSIQVNGSYAEQRFVKPTLPKNCHFNQPQVTFTMPATFSFSCQSLTSPRDAVIEFDWPVTGIFFIQQDDDGKKVRQLIRPLSDGVIYYPMHDLAQKKNLFVTFMDFTKLGAEHLLSGYDHLLFIFTIMLLIGFSKKLIWTISAFTFGHSVTLVISYIGFINIRQGPIEMCIALSICILATEAIQQIRTNHMSLTFRYPGLICGTLGLLHGLGFASALKGLGIKNSELFPALLGFNVGIEIAQLLLILTAWFVVIVSRRYLLSNVNMNQVTVKLWVNYGIGIVAMSWTLARMPNLLLLT